MVKITYFVHNTTSDNEKKISSGWNDVGLSDLGIRQAKELKNLIKDKKFDIVFCSDLQRAKDTAQIVFGDKLTVIADKRLRECNYGIYNGKPSEIVEPMQETMIVDRFPSGESCEDVKKRVLDFINFLKSNYNNQEVAIVSHKMPQLALDVLIKHKTWEQAFADDWRKTKSWQPGWEYQI